MYIEKIEKAPCIWIYHNYFDVENFISMIEEDATKSWPYIGWGDSITGDGSNTAVSEYRSSLSADVCPLLNEDTVSDIAEMSQSFKKIFRSIDECIWDYRKSHSLYLNQVEGMQLLKYENNAQYHAHHDHSPQNQRILSLVACFGDEFEGGELEFPYFETSIKLEKNSLVLFPSNYPYTHIAHPVTSGVKYSLVMWFI